MILHRLFWYVIIFSLLGFASCGVESEKEGDKEQTEDASHVDQPIVLSKDLVAFVQQYPVTVVISDESCISCNKKVVEISSKFIGEENLGIVLETAGGVFDISPLLKEEFDKKVCSDFKQQLSKKFKMSHSFILAKENPEEFSTTAISSENADRFEELLQASLSGK